MSINDVLRFSAIFDLPTFHVRQFLPYNVRYLGAFLNPPTLISLINMKLRLLILKKKFHHPHTFPPPTFMDFLDFFHPPLLVYCSYVLVFSKICLLQPPRLLILQLLHPLHVYFNLLGY